MITNFNNFKIAVDTAEHILLTDLSEEEINEEISIKANDVRPITEKNDVLSHMNTLFLNAILNRQELGEAAMERAEKARLYINELLD